jgi:quercetin dioxygenase-like cupin family protein
MWPLNRRQIGNPGFTVTNMLSLFESSLETNGETSLGRFAPPRRQGPPMHIHLAEDEEGRVVSGTLSAVLNGRQITAGPGQSVSFPRGAAHRWWNDADEPLHFEGYTRPVVDLDRYLQAVFEVMNAGSEERPPLFYIAHVALRHRRTQLVLIMPKPVRAVLFRVIVALGALLGRYRGTDWPGCPSRCPGDAPEDGEAR